MMKPWMCHQLGSREHYSIPRALHANDRLEGLVTDAWLPPAWGRVAGASGFRSLAGRYHPDLSSAQVHAFTLPRLFFDLGAKIRRMGAWEAIGRRNAWFQEKAERVLEGMREAERGGVVFSYSYTARRPFQWAKRAGSPCILGQIDPGPEEHRWVRAQTGEAAPALQSEPPSGYWDQWRQEVELADCIVVNSEWSKTLLERGGVPSEKMKIVPLAYERAPQQREQAARHYPERFDCGRPLKVLFLGQVIRRKGVLPLLEAAERMREEPVEFLMVGPDPEGLLEPHRDHPGIRAVGPVDGARAETFYSEADVFVLPTYSDGFALTQLEAAAHRLPLIVSPYCGDVVEPGRNGWVLPEVSATALASVLEECLHQPSRLAEYSRHEMNWERFSLQALGRSLVEAEAQAREFAARGRSSAVPAS